MSLKVFVLCFCWVVSVFQVNACDRRNLWQDDKHLRRLRVEDFEDLRGQHGHPCSSTRPVLKSKWKAQKLHKSVDQHGHPCSSTRPVLNGLEHDS